MGLLSETQIRAVKPGPKELMLNDGDNLYLRVRATGKAWIYRYMWNGKPIKLGMGPYPAVTLAQARAKAYEANSQRANGLDPKEVQDQQAEARIARLHTFELLARAWHSSSQKDREWSQGYAQKGLAKEPHGSAAIYFADHIEGAQGFNASASEARRYLIPVIHAMQRHEFRDTSGTRGAHLCCFYGSVNEYIGPLYSRDDEASLRNPQRFY